MKGQYPENVLFDCLHNQVQEWNANSAGSFHGPALAQATPPGMLSWSSCRQSGD